MNLLELLGILLAILVVAYGLYLWYLVLFTKATFSYTVFKNGLTYIAMTIVIVPILIFGIATLILIFGIIVEVLATIQLW